MLVQIGNYLDVKRGASLSREFYSERGKFIRLTLGNFDYPNKGFKENTSKKDIYFIGDIKQKFILKKGDIITPLTEQVSGLLGETAWIPEDNKYIQSGDVGLVIPNERVLDKKFCYYLLQSPIIKGQLGAGAQQTKIRHTSPDKIKDCVAIIPTKENQIKIGKILYDIDSQINRNETVVKRLQVLSQAIFNKEYFKNIQNYNGFLHDICTLPSGYSFEPSYYDVTGIYNLITIKNVNGVFVDNSRVDKLNKIPQKMKQYCKLNIGDILLSLTGNVGRISINTLENSLLNQRVSKFICEEKYKFYLYLLLNTGYYQEKMRRMASGTSQKNLSPIDLENLPIFIPKNIDSFYNRTNNILTQLCNINIFTTQLVCLKEKLLPLLINGQLQ